MENLLLLMIELINFAKKYFLSYNCGEIVQKFHHFFIELMRLSNFLEKIIFLAQLPKIVQRNSLFICKGRGNKSNLRLKNQFS